MTVSKGRCTLIHCHAGCKLDDILQAAGLEKKDTFYKSESQGTDWKRYIENRENRKIEAVYNYVSSVTGAYVFTKIRLEGKKMLYGIIENNRFSYGLKGQSRKQLKAIYGSLEAIKKAIKEGETVFIAEGEKDIDLLKRQGYTAFTYGSSGDWQSDFAELLRDANVIILADNDAPGKAVAQRIYDDLQGIAKSRKIVVPMPDIEKADISDYFEAGHSKEEFKALINGATLQEKRSAAESLAIKANKDSRTASPDIAKLAGTRLVVASEPPRRMLFDSSLVKTLTGRDTVSARFLHENEFQFKPKFKLILNSNYLPVISDKTVFSSNRVKVVPFERHFTEKEQNKHLKEQLQQEIDGILNWCIQGLSLYRKEGLEPPIAVQIATHEYSEDSDKIGKFISECLEKSDRNLAAKDVYEKYSQWCNDCGLGIDGRTSFYEELKTKNLLSKTGTVTGKTVKNVIKGYSFVDETFHPVDGNFDTPFP